MTDPGPPNRGGGANSLRKCIQGVNPEEESLGPRGARVTGSEGPLLLGEQEGARGAGRPPLLKE